jgi:hypothetical protein
MRRAVTVLAVVAFALASTGVAAADTARDASGAVTNVRV